MNRTLVLGIAIFFAVVGIALWAARRRRRPSAIIVAVVALAARRLAGGVAALRPAVVATAGVITVVIVAAVAPVLPRLAVVAPAAAPSLQWRGSGRSRCLRLRLLRLPRKLRAG